MTSRFYRFPSLSGLATFEASARHRSLKRAAEELNVTPGAIGRQIKALEEELGVSLFSRTQSGLCLTEEGEAFYAVLARSFGWIAEGLDALRAGAERRPVTLACTDAFAKCWLMPRMDDFLRRFPDVCVDHLVSDDPREGRRAEVDLRVRYGSGEWPDETAALLFGDVIYPVAAPSLAARHAGATAADLPLLPLLHVAWADPAWTTWETFLRRAEVFSTPLGGRRFSSFSIAMQACEAGHGVALGWHRFMRERVGCGALVPLTGLKLSSAGRYYLTWNCNLALSPTVRIVRDWLMEMAAADVEADAACPA